jgi:DNA-binding NarL/FixJ family response regulator
MTDARKIRVIVVDDHPVVRFGIVAIIALQPDMEVVGQAGSGEEAVTLCATQTVDIVLMDLRLPGMSGVEAVRILHDLHPALRSVVLTTYEGDEDIHNALEAGAHAYLLKAMSHSELATAIRTVHLGHRYLPAAVSKTLAERFPEPGLSPREMEVLELIVRGRSNKEIGAALFISEATVKWHVNIILSRLNVRDRTQAAVTALQRGIVHLA